MISEKTKERIIQIWEKYASSDKVVHDTKGIPINDIDDQRLEAIKDIKTLIERFLTGDLTLPEFKTALDGYNKRQNLWGFTAAKGQMFFNLLVNTAPSQEQLSALLKELIKAPTNLDEAKAKLDRFESYVRAIYDKGSDKRRVPNPGATAYFLSYFWQVHAPEKWPIMYSSLVNSFTELGLWKDGAKQKEAYASFYALNEAIKQILTDHSGNTVTNWDAEHAFWNHSGNPMVSAKSTTSLPLVLAKEESVQLTANFNISDYVIPRLAKLVELGGGDKSKAAEFEKMVGEAFRFLDFEVDFLGQGTGRNPDAIAKYKEEHTAFIIDAKAYSDGYSLGIDDRAIKEYISYFCPKLAKEEGLNRIGFIIVSNAFRSDLSQFINEVTWTTSVKRFILLSTEALLYLLAYRAKDNLPVKSIIEFLVNNGPVIKTEHVVAEFDDV